MWLVRRSGDSRAGSVSLAQITQGGIKYVWFDGWFRLGLIARGA